MGMETQAILIGHLTIDDVCNLLRNGCGIKALEVRAMRSADYKIIEFYDNARTLQAMNVFLNSYAAEDYAAVYEGASTFATIDFSPSSSDLLSRVASAVGGFVQKISGEPWEQVAVKAQESLVVLV